MDDELCFKRIKSRYEKMLNEMGVQDTRDELEIYMNEIVEYPDLKIGVEYDVLSWWRLNSHKYLILAEIACDTYNASVLYCI